MVVVIVVVFDDDDEISWLLMSDTDRPTQTVQNRSNLFACTLCKDSCRNEIGTPYPRVIIPYIQVDYNRKS